MDCLPCLMLHVIIDNLVFPIPRTITMTAVIYS